MPIDYKYLPLHVRITFRRRHDKLFALRPSHLTIPIAGVRHLTLTFGRIRVSVVVRTPTGEKVCKRPVLD